MKVMAANDPMRGHFIFFKSDVDAGMEVGSVSILLLTKTVELVFIFSSSKCCSIISILYCVGWISSVLLESIWIESQFITLDCREQTNGNFSVACDVKL